MRARFAGRSLAWAIAIAVAAAAPVAAQRDSTSIIVRAATVRAQDALATFGSLVNEQNYRALGFDSPTDVTSATLRYPLREFMVRLDELRTYAGGDPRPLLHPTERMLFPLAVGNATRSSLTLTRRGDSWELYAFGDPTLAVALDRIRAEVVQAAGVGEQAFFVVRVPALNVVLLVHARNGVQFATPVVDDDRFGFRSGQSLPLTDALRQLVQPARDHNGLPT